MSTDGSVIGIYRAKTEYSHMSTEDIVTDLENDDFSKLSCADVLRFDVDPQTLADGLDNGFVASNSEMQQDLKSEFAAGARVLRVAPTNGKHVKLFILEDLL